MTSFYPYQWDLNYANPMVFNDMTENLLFLTNRGMDVILLDAIPYIWKELGTDCRNLPRVHTLSRMLRLACEIVCPGVLLLGEVVMEPAKVAPYFGTREKPECHLLYNVTTMCSTWNCLATRDIRLLRRQMDQLSALPRSCSFQNYLRCHDDIGWGLDYGAALELARLVLSRGRRCPVYIGAPEQDAAAGLARRQGVQAALREAGRNPDLPTEISGFEMEAGRAAMEQLMVRVPALDAVLCATDRMAFGAMYALRAVGKRLPEEVSVTGMGDSWAGEHIEPHLTTAHFYYKTCGATAARLLVERINRRDDTLPVQQTMLSYTIKRRNSV